MRITIIALPHRHISGMQFKAWRIGETYDVSPHIATLLIVEGWARLEMRTGLDRRIEKRLAHIERRHENAKQHHHRV